jgi:hypothetical protein
MSLEALECPVCGAHVQGDPTAPLLACRYCNTVLRQQAAAPAQPAPTATAQQPAPASLVVPGARVLSIWAHSRVRRFYGATVRGVDTSGVLLAWDDGSTPTYEDAAHVIVPVGATRTNCHPGQLAAARWKDGVHYGATLLQHGPQGFLVAWDDGTAPTWVPEPGVLVSRTPSPGQWHVAGGFGVGTRVRARWRGGSYYGASALRFDGQRYWIRWDDGTTACWVDAREVVVG